MAVKQKPKSCLSSNATIIFVPKKKWYISFSHRQLNHLWNVRRANCIWQTHNSNMIKMIPRSDRSNETASITVQNSNSLCNTSTQPVMDRTDKFTFLCSNGGLVPIVILLPIIFWSMACGDAFTFGLFKKSVSFSHISCKGLKILVCVCSAILLPHQAQWFWLHKPIFPHYWPRCW